MISLVHKIWYTYIQNLCYRIKILLVYKNKSLNRKIEYNNPDNLDMPTTKQYIAYLNGIMLDNIYA